MLFWYSNLLCTDALFIFSLTLNNSLRWENYFIFLFLLLLRVSQSQKEYENKLDHRQHCHHYPSLLRVTAVSTHLNLYACSQTKKNSITVQIKQSSANKIAIFSENGCLSRFALAVSAQHWRWQWKSSWRGKEHYFRHQGQPKADKIWSPVGNTLNWLHMDILFPVPQLCNCAYG